VVAGRSESPFGQDLFCCPTRVVRRKLKPQQYFYDRGPLFGSNSVAEQSIETEEMCARPDFTERWMINGHDDSPQQYDS
jgi:hypothetical protein